MSESRTDIPTNPKMAIPFVAALDALDEAIRDCDTKIEIGLQCDPPRYFNEVAKQKVGLVLAQGLIQRMSSVVLCWTMWDHKES